MAEQPATLQATRDNLHGLSFHLLEQALRAQAAGSATLVVPTATFQGLALAMFKAVLSIEAAVGGAAPVPGGPPAPPAGFDASAFLAQVTAQAEARIAEVQRQAAEDLQKQLDKSGVSSAPNAGTGATP